jgi:hypothetical protein
VILCTPTLTYTCFCVSLRAALHILSATYGDLNEPKYALEVTQQLQDMCDAQVLDSSPQRGCSLELG